MLQSKAHLCDVLPLFSIFSFSWPITNAEGNFYLVIYFSRFYLLSRLLLAIIYSLFYGHYNWKRSHFATISIPKKILNGANRTSSDIQMAPFSSKSSCIEVVDSSHVEMEIQAWKLGLRWRGLIINFHPLLLCIESSKTITISSSPLAQNPSNCHINQVKAQRDSSHHQLSMRLRDPQA